MLGCAADNDEGCEQIQDCPPPCLTAVIGVELLSTASDDFVAPTDEGSPELPGAGTYTFQFTVGARVFACTRRGEHVDCDDGLAMWGKRLLLERGPAEVEFDVSYESPSGEQSVLAHVFIEPEYTLEIGEEICGECPSSMDTVEVPTESIALAEGYDRCGEGQRLGGDLPLTRRVQSSDVQRPHAWRPDIGGSFVFRATCRDMPCTGADRPTVMLVDANTCRILAPAAEVIERTLAAYEEVHIHVIGSHHRGAILTIEEAR